MFSTLMKTGCEVVAIGIRMLPGLEFNVHSYVSRRSSSHSKKATADLYVEVFRLPQNDKHSADRRGVTRTLISGWKEDKDGK